jgi:uncharacterized protein with FMN-binding domain
MDKSTLLLLAVVLAVFGGSVAAGHPAWGTFTGIAIILLAAGLAAGTLPLKSQDYFDERIGPTQRISSSLITLSSAAIVAIYAAGYHRTSSAAHKFDSQTPQARGSTTVATVTPPPPPSPATKPGSSGPPAPASKKNNSRPATPRKGAPKKSGDSATSSAPSPASDKAAPDATATPAAAAKAAYKDGVYLGWGSCRHGDIEASVTIQDGKIASAVISQCLTRYSCNWIAPKPPAGALPDLPAQVVERQSAKVDYVSGATESSYAFADAVIAALAKATE